MSDPEPTADELRQCARTLAALRADPTSFLARTTDPDGQLREIRAEANRLIAALQRATREHRESKRPPRRPRSTPAPASQRPATCYMCRRPLAGSGSGRRGLCRACAELNDSKRLKLPCVDGMHALVTGGRVGIGYATALRLLRGGARVDVVTRFPYDAASRFWREHDSILWRGRRLRIHGLDLRDLVAVERFGRYLAEGDPPDIVINNAAQTIRRPAAYYRNTADLEGPNGDAIRQASARLVCPYSAHLDRPDRSALRALIGTDDFTPPAAPPAGAVTRIMQRMLGLQAPAVPTPAAASALLASTPLLPGDVDSGQWLVADPSTGESIDLRPSNTWTQTFDEVDMGELIEVHCANALAPFILLKALVPAMERSRFPKRFVVNLAAAEGSFRSGHGRGTHPHTNMAKASLNMLTRTLGNWLAEKRIYINSVDPGWVSDQRPFDVAQRAVAEDWLRDVLTADDGAARVTDPITLGIGNHAPPFGRLWRNFEQVGW